MSWAKNLVSDYYTWLKEKTFIQQDNSSEWALISTPFIGVFNDGIELYARKADNKITLSDNGETLNNLSLLGIEFNNRSKKRVDLLHRILRNYGVGIVNGELLLEASEKNFSQKKHNFLSALVEINDFQQISKHNVASIFKDDVASYLDELEIIYTPDVIFKGATGLDFSFDFQIASRKSEITIKAFNGINTLNLPGFLFSLDDVKSSREKITQKVLKPLAIINDIGKQPKSEYLEALKSRDADYILWSDRKSERSKSLLEHATI